VRGDCVRCWLLCHLVLLSLDVRVLRCL
jgi:hypothetical protein